MNLKLNFLTLSLLVCIAFPGQGKEIRYENYIYESYIKTVICFNSTIDDPAPVIILDGADKLKLSFDDLRNVSDYYQYTFVHCDANWNPTATLRPNEYLKGSLNENFQEYRFSTNTYQKYVHYDLTFPTENMKPSISGNYILKVFRNYDETDLILTRRFMVNQQKVVVNCMPKPATRIESRFTKQEVDLEVGYNGYNIPFPFRDVKVVITQNNRWDNAITNLVPQMVSDNKLIYNYELENLFNGGNEFRFFDLRSIRFYSQNVKEKYFDTLTHAILDIDENKAAKLYFQLNDFNGRRLIANKDGKDGEIDGDYVVVHFSLPANAPFTEGDLYVLGELSDWRAQDEFKMRFNEVRRMYEASIPIKQGYYNYIYAVSKDGAIPYDETKTEGSHFDAENDYRAYVYHRNQFYDYDELVGMVKVNTRTR
jgi:hypothetical protein